MFGLETVLVLSQQSGRFQESFPTPETTKPLHFCGGFVLYGAAPNER